MQSIFGWGVSGRRNTRSLFVFIKRPPPEIEDFDLPSRGR
jgi:hypothetical protein